MSPISKCRYSPIHARRLRKRAVLSLTLTLACKQVEYCLLKTARASLLWVSLYCCHRTPIGEALGTSKLCLKGRCSIPLCACGERLIGTKSLELPWSVGAKQHTATSSVDSHHSGSFAAPLAMQSPWGGIRSAVQQPPLRADCDKFSEDSLSVELIWHQGRVWIRSLCYDRSNRVMFAVQNPSEKHTAEQVRMCLRRGVQRMLDNVQQQRELEPSNVAAMVAELTKLKQVNFILEVSDRDPPPPRDTSCCVVGVAEA